MAYEFMFPDVGEGIAEGELLSWKVAAGDTVAEDQTLAEMETDKAVVELPSPKAGVVAKLHAEEGDIVPVGSVLVTIEESEAATVSGAAPAPTPADEQPPAEAATRPTETPAAAVPSTEAPEAEAPAVAAPAPEPGAAPPAEAAPSEEEEHYTGSVVGQLEEAAEEEAPTEAPAPAAPGAKPETVILALPSVRALAKELGVDLSTIRGTGAGGRILKQDVQDVAQSLAYGAPAVEPVTTPPTTPAAAAPAETPAAAAPGAAPPQVQTPIPEAVPEEDAYGPVERAPFRGVRRTMAKRMTESATKQAQVTTMDQADVTVIRHIRNKEKEVAKERGVNLTYLAFVVKACTSALKRFPRLNATLEESGEEYILKRYYNLGIAVDTTAGLVVPNIKDADKKSIFVIAEEIIDLVKKSEERRLTVEDLHGGTFTITNYGAIGGTYATPIVNYPEVAILGMGRIAEAPYVRDGQVAVRLVLPLALTFDHRLVDGAEAARFLNTVIGYLEDPDLLLLEGA